MDPIFHAFGTVEGNEILYFENAQVEKVKGNSVSFASVGTLSVLYFKDYDRFVLLLNDWKYPLLRRLPVVAEKHNDNEMTFIFPAANGFSYRLNLGYVPSFKSLNNFERILCGYSNFSFRGEETPFRKSEVSPDDKLTRKEKKDTGITNIISETIKLGVEKAKVYAGTIKTHTADLGSRKKALNLKELKNRNFNKRAKATFNKAFFETGMKLTDEFVRERTNNINLVQHRELKDLKIGYQLPRLYIRKEELEDRILDNKELAAKGNLHLSGFEAQRGRANQEKGHGFVESLKQGFKEIKHTFSEMLTGPHVDEGAARQRTEHVNPQVYNDPTYTEFDTMQHYHG